MKPRLLAVLAALILLPCTADIGGHIAFGAENEKPGPSPERNRRRSPTEEKTGLIQNGEKSFKGYTLLCPTNSTTTYLIDNDGKVVNKWETDYPGQCAYLLPNGHLLLGTTSGPGGGFAGNRSFQGGGAGERVVEYTWEGELVWDFKYATEDHLLHHDIEPLPNGNVLMIAWERKSADDAIAAGRDPKVQGNSELWTDYVIEVKPTGKTTGEIVWEWHVWDHLVQDADPSKPNYEAIEDHPELIHINPIDWIADLSSEDLQKLNSLGYVNAAPIGRGGPDFAHPDWNHTNGISYNAELDQIVLSVLGFNEIWIIDHSTTTEQAASHKGGSSKKGGDLLYRWGNPMAYRMGSREDQQLFAQHDATWVKRADGTWSILVFNNGRGRQDGDYSSVDEILLPVDQRGRYSYEEGTAFGPDKPTWSYTAAQKDEFFSTHISGAQRLPNGNTLICAGDGATLFEVTESLEVVWKYVCPVRSPGPGMGRGGRPGGPEGDRNPMDTQVTAQSRTGTPPDLDTNSDGVVTYEEASTLPFMNKDVFKWLDQDGNGTLSQDELPQGPPNDRRGRGQRGPGGRFFGGPGGPGGGMGGPFFGRPGGPGGGMAGSMIFKVRRYAPDYAGLTGKDLTPGEAIEASGQGEPSSAP